MPETDVPTGARDARQRFNPRGSDEATIDLHSHILPGLDDGARSLEEALELARVAASGGTGAIAATPHVRDDYPTTADEMERGVAAVRRIVAEAEIAIDILHGGEVALDRLARLSREDVLRFTLGQTGRYLLVEFPYHGWPFALEGAMSKLGALGVSTLIAHPERNPEVQQRPELLASVVSEGGLVQITAASLDGRLGRASRRAAHRLLQLRIAHVVASDAHGPSIREAGLEAAARAVGDSALARYLTVEAPAAIAAGEPVRPPPRVRRRWPFGRRSPVR